MMALFTEKTGLDGPEQRPGRAGFNAVAAICTP
jgi:hypothetical protein